MGLMLNLKWPRRLRKRYPRPEDYLIVGFGFYSFSFVTFYLMNCFKRCCSVVWIVICEL